MFGLFGRSREIDEFAATLAREFAGRFPPGVEAVEAARLAKAIDDVCNRANAFKREKKLGVYGRARIGTSFKMELKSAGYPPDFIDGFTRQLLLVMSGR
jgi:hypothetical protein